MSVSPRLPGAVAETESDQHAGFYRPACATAATQAQGYDAAISPPFDDERERPRALQPSFQILPRPRGRAIQLANTDPDESGRLEVCCVYSHRVSGALFSMHIVGDTTTCLAAKVCADLAAPGVTGQTARRSFDSYRGWPVVRPEGAVPAADRAIAAGHGARCSTHMDADSTAMASGGEAQSGDSYGACR
jgi:hypothetical protein